MVGGGDGLRQSATTGSGRWRPMVVGGSGEWRWAVNKVNRKKKRFV